jgi:hypothetical protein
VFKRLAAALLYRRVSRDLSDIAASLRLQNVLLVRLVDRLAPADPTTERQEVRVDTGVSHLDVDEAGLAADYIARVQRDTGHVPDDEEVLIYLADEKTHDLQARLVARDVELQRLREAREW